MESVAEMSSFTKPLIIEFDFEGNPEKPYRLDEPFSFMSNRFMPGAVVEIKVTAGYRTDFASIPRFFWRILPPAGRYGKAAVVHDWLCDEKPHTCSSKVAADVFDEAMQVLKVNPIKRAVMVAAVRLFGPRFKPEPGGSVGFVICGLS